MRHNKEIKLVDMTGLLDFAGIWKAKEQVFVSPPYYVFQMYSVVKDQTVLPVTTDSGTYSVMKGTGGDGNVQDVPYIDIAATKSADGKTLTLFCVNRSLTAAQAVKFDLGGFQATGDVDVESLVSKDRYEMNTEEHPDNVKPTHSTMAASAAMQITLPHESVMVLHLHAR
jgi:alpha-N-arabinofuranosidase